MRMAVKGIRVVGGSETGGVGDRGATSECIPVVVAVEARREAEVEAEAVRRVVAAAV